MKNILPSARIMAATVGAAMFAAPMPALAAPAMWVVRDSDSTIYLFGTAHAAREDSSWRTPALDEAIGRADTLWLEVASPSDPAAGAALMQRFGMDPANPLPAKLSPAQNEKLNQVLESHGLPAARIAPLRPWLAAMMIARASLAKAGLDPAAGADRIIRSTAEAEGDAIEGFDTVEQQMRYLADLPEEVQIAFLMDVIERANEAGSRITRTSEAWESGDLEGLDEILNAELKERFALLYDRLIVTRNRNYVDRIAALLDGNGTHFVAIGAGHLVGDDSIQANLAGRGIAVERIQ